VWLLDDLDTLAARERVPVRRVAGDAVQHLLPVFEPSPPADVARGLRPYWDYISLVAQMGR
jgi:hypothetical protein